LPNLLNSFSIQFLSAHGSVYLEHNTKTQGHVSKYAKDSEIYNFSKIKGDMQTSKKK